MWGCALSLALPAPHLVAKLRFGNAIGGRNSDCAGLRCSVRRDHSEK